MSLSVAWADIEGVACTENAVVRHAGRPSILLAWGGNFPQKLPILLDHDRSKKIGTADAFHQVDKAWHFKGYILAPEVLERMHRGELQYLSIGIRVRDCELVQPGQVLSFPGSVIRWPGNEPLRVTALWDATEISLTDEPADPACLITNRVFHFFK